MLFTNKPSLDELRLEMGKMTRHFLCLSSKHLGGQSRATESLRPFLLHNKVEFSLGYVRPCVKKTKQNKLKCILYEQLALPRS